MTLLPDALRSALGSALRSSLRASRGRVIYAHPLPTVFDFTQASAPASFVFTSSGGRTYFKADGLMYTTAANEWPLEYDPVTHALLGRSMPWEARNNYCKWSADLTQATWVKTSCTAALNLTNLFGTANAASTLTATGANATAKQTITLTATACGAFYLKRITGTGTINISRDGGTTLVPVTLTSAWQRFSIPSAAVTNPVLTIQIVTSGDAIGVLGATMEAGAFAAACTFNGPLIPTTSATVSRLAETAVMNPITLPNFNASAGTLVVTGRAPPANNAIVFNVFASLSDGTANNRITLYMAATAIDKTFVVNGGTLIANLQPANLLTYGGTFKQACSWAPAAFAASLNQGTVVTVSSGAVPAMTRLDLGNQADNAGRSGNGYLTGLTYYPYAVSNTKLVTL